MNKKFILAGFSFRPNKPIYRNLKTETKEEFNIVFSDQNCF